MQVNLVSKITCAVVCVAAFSCGGGNAADQKSFVSYWADSSSYCAKAADECHQISRADCEQSWPKPSAVEHAIDLANLNSNDLARCEKAGRAEDECYRKLQCAALSSDQQPCQKEVQRVQLDCAALLKALELPGPDDASTDRTNSAQPDGGGENVGKELCDRAAECLTEPYTAEELNACIDQVNQAFASVLPDPHATVECLKQSDCAALENDGQSVTRGCIDLDPDATHCVDDMTLHICNRGGVCRDVRCVDSCELLSATAVGCGFNQTDGYDKCQCALP